MTPVVTIQTPVLTTALTVIGVIAAALIGAWFARRSHREDTVRDEVRALRREVRLLSDYVHVLRNALDEAGEDVPPYPEALISP
ncbi:hypothetical protein [Cellulomonas hominis]|uniref:hypothetical protein n=1 Tax=Cellulomonas hominis TaxID=156981 RepID=UPI001444870F|nr:hypothetical protein [Cellulomonas hominis]NKY08960.1 hypothetical protein [Cellulomonas hominis]